MQLVTEKDKRSYMAIGGATCGSRAAEYRLNHHDMKYLVEALTSESAMIREQTLNWLNYSVMTTFGPEMNVGEYVEEMTG